MGYEEISTIAKSFTVFLGAVFLLNPFVFGRDKIKNKTNEKLFKIEQFVLFMSLVLFTIYAWMIIDELHIFISIYMVVIGVSVFFYNYVYHDCRHKKKEIIGENHTRAFISIIIFIFGTITIYNFYIDHREYKKKLLKERGYTIALRAWGCEVYLEDIEVQYLDSNNIWVSVGENDLYEKSSWKGPVWKGDNDESPAPDHYFDIVNRRIKLRDSGIIFSPEFINKYTGSKNIHIKTKLTLKGIEDRISTLDGLGKNYYSIQFCMNIPAAKIDYEKILDSYSSLEFFFVDFMISKIRNPVLKADNFLGNQIFDGNIIKNEDISVKKLVNDVRTKVLKLCELEVLPEKPEDKMGQNKIDIDQAITLSAKLIEGKLILSIINSDTGFHKDIYNGPISAK